MEKIEYPFVYIASLMRTGSTVAQEALTKLPYSFIFHEPQLCRSKFNIKQRFLDELDIDVKSLMNPPTIEVFATRVVPKLKQSIKQIGVKEIENAGWRNYVKYFPNIKIILMGRNPRDIYISIHYWFARKKTDKWKDGRILTPKVLCQALSKDFEMQKNMYTEYKAVKVRYENLCLDTKEVVEYMKKFVNSPIPDIGEVGGFLSNNPKRIGEYELHGNEITNNRVFRWKRETDKELVKKAHIFHELMEDYCNFWGYK
jgi:hypothetical protein